MAKTKKEDKRAEEIVPLKCYACSKYDGAFGPISEQYTHVCDICKDLPTADILAEGPIQEHEREFYEKRVEFEKEAIAGLACESCGLETDECRCSHSRAHYSVDELLGDFQPVTNEEIREAEQRVGPPAGQHPQQIPAQQMEYIVPGGQRYPIQRIDWNQVRAEINAPIPNVGQGQDEGANQEG